MPADRAIDEISPGQASDESKSESHANAVTLEHLEEELEPHLHLKTFLIIAVSYWPV